MVVRVRLAGLDDEHVPPTHIFLQLDLDRPIQERPRLDSSDRVFEAAAHVAHKLGV